ncbi:MULTISPECIES: efflux RND transporter periplasmic adaptor subunit [Stenotrophomonas]|uniref:Efflux RND transporter periplasmic adaptor subunit n=1 Tax=Stenotrophomonas maltophilia TaxID=40324 RepID=A0A4S2CRX0_STEMA|nr:MULTISPECIES: efflux RND transporter periplasmic adaptor subunit [Stenotrophomonas]TGY31032.1 efflux RND transporter periplasmic adaptor subunit [Stenotrophomonas maltophilia]
MSPARWPAFAARRRLPWLAGAALLLIALAWWLWPSTPSEAPAEAAPKLAADGSLELTDSQLRAQGIASEAVTAATTLPLPGLPAQAAAPLDASAQVVVPYAGVVTRILVDEGARVAKGQPLARIQSRELLLAQADLARASSEATAASLQARRDRELLSEGIIAAARDEQSRARAAAAAGALRQASGALSQLRPVSAGQPGEYELLAPMAGQVLRRMIQPGQALAALDEAFSVAEPGPLDIRFIAPVRVRATLAPGQAVLLPDGAVARVVAIGADTDPASQSLRVRAQVAADAGLVAGQQFGVTLQLPAPPGSLAVPTPALLPAGDGHVLYRIDGRRVRVVPVQALLGGDANTSIVSAAGLAPGVRVVTRGTVMLKSLIPVQAAAPADAGADPAAATRAE